MKDHHVKKYADQPHTSTVYLKDGTVLVGNLETVEADVYNVVPLPSQLGVVEGGLLQDITADEIERIE